MSFSKCLRAKINSNMHVYFDPQGCQTLLLKESDPLIFSFGSWTNRRIQLKEIAQALDISHCSVSTILHGRLGMRKLTTRWVPSDERMALQRLVEAF